MNHTMMNMQSEPVPSLFPLEVCPHVPDESFKVFHTIDRELYACLTRKLRRDPAESIQVMAFLMWLERQCRLNFIHQMPALPPPTILQIASEAAMCIKCVESDAYLFGDDGNEIKVLSEFLKLPALVSLRYFHENRIAVLRGVAKIINTVCWRAFGDIYHGAYEGGGSVAGVPVPVPFVGESSREAEQRVMPPHVLHRMYNPYHSMPLLPLPAGGLMRMPHPQPHVHAPHRLPVAADVLGLPLHMLAAGGFPVYDVSAQRQMLNNELGDLMRTNLKISNAAVEETENQEQEIAPDDRTIFLTFSKGYPTTEEEVKEYFTKKFGDFIEDLIMQEVEGGEQPLYAKMVAKSPEVIDGIVEGNKAKYSIGGKHVWARKYVKKPPQSQQRSPPKGEAPGSFPSPGKKA